MKLRSVVASVLAASLVSVAALSVKAEDDDKDLVTLDQVPKPVKVTLLKETNGGEIKEINREQKNGKTIYEADAVINGDKYEIKVAPDGNLIKKKLDNEDDDDKGDGK